MAGSPGTGRAALVNNNIHFEERDALLLREIDKCGSINQAAAALGRSHARSLRRIDALESAFGPLVERTRGGTGGGGSRLTQNGRAVLDRYNRLSVAVDATAQISETVLHGTVEAVSGELADVVTDIGIVRGVHTGIAVGDTVQVRVPSDVLTIHDSDEEIDPNSTSARNQRRAVIDDIDYGTTIHSLLLAVDGVSFSATVTEDSLDRLGVSAGDTVVITWKATATRLVESSYQGQAPD